MDIDNVPQPQTNQKSRESSQTSVIFAARHLGSPYIWSMTVRNFSCTSQRRKVVLLKKSSMVSFKNLGKPRCMAFTHVAF